VDERLGRLRMTNVELVRDLEGSGRVGIDDRESRDARERLQRSDVEDADPPDADHAHMEACGRSCDAHGSGYCKRLHQLLSSVRVEARTTSSGSSRWSCWRTSFP